MFAGHIIQTNASIVAAHRIIYRRRKMPSDSNKSNRSALEQSGRRGRGFAQRFQLYGSCTRGWQVITPAATSDANGHRPSIA